MVLVVAVTDLVAHILVVMVVQVAERLVRKLVDYLITNRAVLALLGKVMPVDQTIPKTAVMAVAVAEQGLSVLITQLVLVAQA